MINNEHKIVVRNTSIIVNDYDMGDCPRLEYSFRVYDALSHGYFYLGMFYDKDKRRLYLPRGIDIYHVENLIKEKAYIDHSPTKYDEIDNVSINVLPRDNEQKEALRFMIGTGEYTNNKYASQLSVNLNTGKGKTYVSVATIAYLGIRSIIIASNNSWLKQWKRCIGEYTDIKPKEIYHINGSASINMILSGKSKAVKEAKIFLVNHSSITSYAGDNGWDSITNLFETLKIGITVYDEAHLNFSNICMIDYYTNTFRTYYVTATPCKSDENENRIYQLYLKNIPKIDLFDEDKDPHTQYLAIKYNSLPNPSQISECRNMYGLNRIKYIDYLLSQENFYKVLRVVLKMIFKMDGKFLFYIGTNAGIMQVYNWLQTNYPEISDDIGIYTSIIPAEEKEKQKEKRFILTTSKSAGAALDIKGLKATIILAEPFKSQVIARQILGRTRDKDTYCIEFVDLGFSYTKKYYYYKLPIMGRYATEVNDITLLQVELDQRVMNIILERENISANFFKFKPYNPIINYNRPQLIDPIIRIRPKNMNKGIIFLNEENRY